MMSSRAPPLKIPSLGAVGSEEFSRIHKVCQAGRDHPGSGFDSLPHISARGEDLIFNHGCARLAQWLRCALHAQGPRFDSQVERTFWVLSLFVTLINHR